MPSHNSSDCQSISINCPVQKTVYGYYPSLGANAFFCAFFSLCLAINFIFGIRYRTWTYMIAMTLGCLAQVIGYVGRILLNSNPFSTIGFQIQICCLTIAPAFTAAAIYLTLKHLALCFGPEHSRLRPMLYTWIFIGCDLFSLVLQGAGGGLAATADNNPSQRKIGTDLMITGIVGQVVTLIAFATMISDYFIRLSRSKQPLSPEAQAMKSNRAFQLFSGGLIIAFVTIFTRCVYRIAEMAGGWRNSIMRNQTEFIALEGVMIVIAVFCLTAFHPGYCFPRLAAPVKTLGGADVEKKMGSDSGMEETG